MTSTEQFCRIGGGVRYALSAQPNDTDASMIIETGIVRSREGVSSISFHVFRILTIGRVMQFQIRVFVHTKSIFDISFICKDDHRGRSVGPMPSRYFVPMFA